MIFFLEVGIIFIVIFFCSSCFVITDRSMRINLIYWDGGVESDVWFLMVILSI